MKFELPQTFEEAAHNLLVWIGFGTLVGLIAKGVMPGRDPGGAITTLIMGIGGSVIGSGILVYFAEGQRVTPLSLPGFLVAVGGAFVLLSFYRLLSGRMRFDGRLSDPYYVRRPRSRRSKTLVQRVDDLEA